MSGQRRRVTLQDTQQRLRTDGARFMQGGRDLLQRRTRRQQNARSGYLRKAGIGCCVIGVFCIVFPVVLSFFLLLF